jgi:hypothetical protein
MNTLIYATKLWVNGQLFTDTTCTSVINCLDFQLYGKAPMNVWLIPTWSCGGDSSYELQTVQPDPMPLNALQGVWIPDETGEGIVLNALSAADVIAACQNCCGGGNAAADVMSSDEMLVMLAPNQTQLPVRYSSLPLNQTNLPTQYVFSRTDNGTITAYTNAMMAYYGQYLIGTFKMVSRDTGAETTTYTFQSFKLPAWLATDTGSGITFQSNTVPSLPVDKDYVFNLTADGIIYFPVIEASVDELINYLNTSDPFKAMGTWSHNETLDTIQLYATTVLTATLGISVDDVFTYASNDATVPLPADKYYSFNMTNNGVGILPVILNKLTLQEIVDEIQNYDSYLTLGTYEVQADAIVLSSTQSGLPLVLEINLMDAIAYHSNVAPVDDPEKVYAFHLDINGDVVFPSVAADTLANLVIALNGSTVYNVYGSYTQDSGIVTLTSNHVPPITLTVTQVVQNIFTSNAAPVEDPSQLYNLNIQINGSIYGGDITGATLEEVVNAANSNSQYDSNMFGTYSTGTIETSNYIFLTSAVAFSADLVITLVDAPAFVSNAAPVVPGGQHLTATIVLDSVMQYPILSGANVTALAALLTATAPYSTAGSWTVVDTNKIQLRSNLFTSVTITLAASNVYLTNPAPTLTSGQIFQLAVHYNGLWAIPAVVGATLADVVLNIPTSSDYVTIGGTWSVVGTQIQLSGSTQTDVYLELTAITEPVFVSNVAPVITPGERLTFTSILDNVVQYPMIGVGASNPVTDLAIATTSPYSGYGTWTYPGGDKVQLETAKFAGGTLSLSSKNFFLSNQAPTLTGGEIYRLRINSNGSFVSVDVVGATLAALVTNLPPGFDPVIFGTLSVQVDQIRCTNILPGITAPVYVLLNAMTSPVFLSNVAPVVPVNQHLSITVQVGPNIVYPILSAGDVTFLRTRIAGIAPFSGYGTWTLVGGNKIQLATTKYNPMTLTLTASNEFISNPAPTLTSGQTYQLDVYFNTAFVIPPVLGNTLDIILAAIPTTGDYATIGGTWSKGGTGNDQIILTGSTETGIYLVLSAITRPPLAVDSNSAPVLTPGDEYVLTAILDFATLSPTITGLTVAALATNAQANPTYAAAGTWTVNTDKVHLASTTLTSGQLTITTQTIP